MQGCCSEGRNYCGAHPPFTYELNYAQPTGWQRAGDAAAAAPDASKECGAVLYCCSAAAPQPSATVEARVTIGGQDAAEKPGPDFRNNPTHALVKKATGVATTRTASAVAVGGDESQGAVEMRQLWVVTMQRRAAQLDLSGQMMESLPQSVFHLRALRRLVLDDNFLRALPDDIGCLPSLRELSCDNNRLAEVPPVLAAGNVCNLVLLSLGNNLISEVPSWASCLVGLKTLNLQVSPSAHWHTRDSQAYN